MMRFRPLLASLTAFALLFSLMAAAYARPSVTPADQPPHQSFMLPIASQLGQQLQTLIVGTTAPAADPAATPAANATPTTPAPDASPPTDDDAEPQDNFGVRALNFIISSADLLRSQGQLMTTNIGALPQINAWFAQQRSDTRLQARWAAIGNDMIYVVGISLLVGIALELLLLPARSTLRKRRPSRLAYKIATLVGLLSIRLIPIFVFVGVSLTLLDHNETQRLVRFVILSVVYALTLSRIALAVIRTITVPRTPDLRLIHANNAQALYAWRSLSAFSLVIIYGYFFIDVAKAVRIPLTAINAFGNLFGFILAIMAIVVITQKRAFVAILLRGPLSAAQPDLSLWQSLRLWFARRWHILAITYIVIGFGITALGINGGFAILLRGTILSLLVLATMRLFFHAIDRKKSKSGEKSGTGEIHHSLLRFILRGFVWMVAALGIAASWGVDLGILFSTSIGQRVVSAVISIGVTVVVVTVIYEAFNSAVDRHLNRRDAEGNIVQASARSRTLLPMIRNTAFILFAIVVGLVVMSEVGINIAPLLAGAGVLGVAIGFGSQALVKDFLTGLFIVLENTIAIGDVIKIDGHSGVVEGMSIRTLRLRDSDGSLHILPFSEVSKIINMTRDFAFANVNVGVSYESDLDHVMKVIRMVGEDMQNDPIFKRVIIEPVEILGVDNLGDSSITIASRMRTRPGKQWDVRRMFLLKLKQRFDKEGIEIPYPTVTNIQRVINVQGVEGK